MNSTTSSNTKETITYKTEVIPGKDIVLVKEREILIPIKTQTKTETYIIEENVPIDYNEEYDHHQGEILIEENSPQIEEEVEIVEQVSRTYESPKKSNLTQSEIFPEKSKTKFSKVLFASEEGSTPLKDKDKSSAMNMKVVSSVERSSNKKRGNNDSFISNLTQVTQIKKGPYDYTYLFRDDYITDEQAALSKSTFVNLKEGYRLSESQKSFSSIKDKEREHKDSDIKLTQGIRTDLNWENLPNALMNRSISHTMSSRGPRIPSTNRSINVGYANVGTINTNKPSHEKEMQTSTTTTKVQTENWMKKPQSSRVRSYQMRTVNNNNNNNNEQQQSATNTTVKDVSNDDKKMSYQQRREERRLRREKEEAENKKREEFYRLKREREQKELEEKRKKESDEHKQQMVIDELQRLRNLKKQNDIHNHPLTNVTTTTITNVKDVVVDDKEVVPHDNEVIVNTSTTKESELLPTKKVVIENKGDKIIKTTTKETVKTIVKEIHDEEPVQIKYINDNTNESVDKEHNNFVYVINGSTPSIKSNNINTTNTHLVDVAPQHQQTITETSVITRKQTQIKQIIDTNNEQQHNESIQPVVPEEITINNAIQPQSSSLPIMNEKSISPIKNNSNSNSKRIITEPGKESKLPITDPIQPTTLFKTKKNEKNLPLQVTPTDTTNVSVLPVDKKEINLPLNINSNNSTPKKPQIVTHEEQRVDHKGKRLDDVLAKVNEKKFVGEPQVETRIIDVEKRQGTPKKEINNKDNDDGNVIMTTTVTTKKTLIVVKKEKTDDNNNVIKEDIGVLPLNKESNESKNVEQVKTVYINDNVSKPKEEINVEKKSDNNENSSKPDIQKETTVITTLTETTTKEEDKKENDDDKNKKKKNATLTKIKPKEITAPSYFYITDELIESKKDNDDDVNVDNTDKEVKKEEDVVKKEVEKVKDEPNKTTTTTTTTITTITTTVTSKEEPKTDNIIYTSITTTDNKPKETEDVSNLRITTLHKPEEQEPQKEHIIIPKEPITKEETTITLKETPPISTKEPQTEIKEEHNTITSTIVNDDLPKKDNLNYTPTKHEPKTKSLTYITSTSNSYYPHQQDQQQPSSSKFTTVITSSNTSTTPFDASLPPRNTPIIAPLRSSKPAIVRNQYVYKYEDEPFIEENYESTVNPNDIDSMLSSQDLIHKSKRQPLHEQKAIFKNYYGRQGQSYSKDLTEIFSQDILPDVTTSQIQSQRDNNDEVKQPITHNTTTITTIVSTGETQTPNTEGNFRFKAIPPEPDPTQEEEEEQTQKQFHKSNIMIPQYHSTLNEEEKESPICDDEHKEIEDNKLYNEKGVIPGIIKAAVVPKKESPTEIKEDDVNDNDNDNDQRNVVIKTTTITTTTTTTTNVVPDKEDDNNDTQEQNVIKFKFVGKNTNNQNNSRYHKNTVRYSVGDDKDDDEIVTTVVPGGKGSTNLRFDSKNKRYGDDDNVIVEEEVNDNKDKSSFDGCSNWRRFGKIAEKKENDDDDCDNNKGRYDNDEHRILMIEKEEPKEEKNDLSSAMNQWKGLSKLELPKETITYNNDNDELKKKEIITTISEPVLVKEETQQQDVPRYICVDNDNIEETPKTVEQQQETSQPEITTTVDQWKDLSEQPKKEEITTTTTTYVVNDDEQQRKETVTTTTTTTIHYIVDDEPKKEETTTTTVTEPVNNREIDIGPKELPRSKAGKRVRMQPSLLANTNSLGSTNLSSIMSRLENLPIEPMYTETQEPIIKDDNVPRNEEILTTFNEPIKTQEVPKYIVEETHKTGTPIQPTEHQKEIKNPEITTTVDQWKVLSEQPKEIETKYTTITTIHYIVDDDVPKKEEVTESIKTQPIEQKEIPMYINKMGTPVNVQTEEKEQTTKPELSSAMGQWKELSKPKETTTTTTIHYIVDDDNFPRKEEIIEPIKIQPIEQKEIPKYVNEEIHKTGTPINVEVKEKEQIKPELSSAMNQWKGLSKQPQPKESVTTYKTKETTITYIVEDEPKKETITTTTIEPINDKEVVYKETPRYTNTETYPIEPPKQTQSFQPQQELKTTNSELSSAMNQWKGLSKQPQPKETTTTTTTITTTTTTYIVDNDIPKNETIIKEIEQKEVPRYICVEPSNTETPSQPIEHQQETTTKPELSSAMGQWKTLSKQSQPKETTTTTTYIVHEEPITKEIEEVTPSQPLSTITTTQSKPILSSHLNQWKTISYQPEHSSFQPISNKETEITEQFIPKQLESKPTITNEITLPYKDTDNIDKVIQAPIKVSNDNNNDDKKGNFSISYIDDKWKGLSKGVIEKESKPIEDENIINNDVQNDDKNKDKENNHFFSDELHQLPLEKETICTPPIDEVKTNEEVIITEQIEVPKYKVEEIHKTGTSVQPIEHQQQQQPIKPELSSAMSQWKGLSKQPQPKETESKYTTTTTIHYIVDDDVPKKEEKIILNEPVKITKEVEIKPQEIPQYNEEEQLKSVGSPVNIHVVETKPELSSALGQWKNVSSKPNEQTVTKITTTYVIENNEPEKEVTVIDKTKINKEVESSSKEEPTHLIEETNKIENTIQPQYNKEIQTDKPNLSSAMGQWKNLSKQPKTYEIKYYTTTDIKDNNDKGKEIIPTFNETIIHKEIEQQNIPFTTEEVNKTGTPIQPIEENKETTKPELLSAMGQWKGLSKQQQPKETTIHYIVEDNDVPKKEEVAEPIEIRQIEQKEIPKNTIEETYKTGTPINVQQIEDQNETRKRELASAMDQWKVLSEQPKQSETKYTTATIHYIVDDDVPKKEEVIELIRTQPIEQKEIPKDINKMGTPVNDQKEEKEQTTKPELSSAMGQWKELSKPKETTTTTTIHYIVDDDVVPKKEEIIEPIEIKQIEQKEIPTEDTHKTGTPINVEVKEKEQINPELSSAMNQWKGLSKQPQPKESVTTTTTTTTIHYIVDDVVPKKEEIIEPIEIQHIEQKEVPKYVNEDINKMGTPINEQVKEKEQTTKPELASAMGQWKGLSKQSQPKETKYTTTTTYVVNDDEQQPKETVTTTTTIHYIVDDEPKKEETTTTTVTEPVNNREIDIGPKELPRSKAEEITKSETLIETQPYEYKHETKKPELSSALGQWKDLSKQPKQSETKYTTTTTHYIVDDNIPKKEEISTITEPIKTQHIEQKDIPKLTTIETYKTGTPIQPQHEQETTKPILSSTMGQWKNISKQPKPKDTKYTTTHTYTYTESITPQKEVTPIILPEQLTSTETVIKHQSTLPNEKLQPIETEIQLSQQPTTNPLVEEETIISPSTITETQYSIPKVKSSAPKQRHHLDQNESLPSLPSNINNIHTLSLNEPIEQTTIQQQIPLASPTQPEEPIEPEMQNQEDEIVHKFIEDIFNTVESEKDSISFQANANETQQQFTPITDLNNNETSNQDNIITIPQLPLNQQLNNNTISSSIIPQIDPLQSIPLIPINDNLNLEAPNLINIPQSITLVEDNNNQPQQIVNEQQLNIETVAEVYQPHRKHQEQVSQTQEIKTTTIHQQQQPQQQSYQPISSSTETQQQQQSITPNNNDQQLFHTISLKFGEVIFEQREIPINEVDTKLIQKPTLSSILKKQTSYEIQEEIIAPSSSNNIPVPEFERTRSSPTLKPQKVSSKNKRNVRLGKAIQFEDIESDPLITTNTFDYNPQLTPAFVATGASIDNNNNNTARKTAYPIKHKPRFETVVTESPSKYSHRTNITNDFVPRKTAMTVMSLPKHILEEEEEDFHDVMQRGPQRSRAKKTKAKITSQKEHNPAQPANTPQHEDACGGCNGNENCVIM